MSELNYVRFFAEHTFDASSELEFFKDGSFAIKSQGFLTLYNNMCNEVAKLSEGRFEILSNGVILQICNNTISAIYNGINKLENTHSLFYRNNSSVVVSGSMLLIRRCADKTQSHTVYEVTETGEFVEKLELPFVDGATLSTSGDNSVFAVGKQFYNMRVFNQDGEIDLSKVKVGKIEVLECGSFINQMGSWAQLFNKKGELLCTGTTLECISDNFIAFNGKLIIDAKNAYIVEEYNKEIKKIALDGTKVYSHKIVNKNGVGYMLGGKLLPSISTSRFRPSLSLIWSQGRFYLINFHSTFYWKENDLLEYIHRYDRMRPHM